MVDLGLYKQSMKILGIKPTGLSHDKPLAPGIFDMNKNLNLYIQW